MGLKYKILLIIISVALLPIFIMSFATARISTSMLIEKEVTSKINILHDISEKVYAAVQDRQLVGITFLLNEAVQTLLAPEENSRLSQFQREKLSFEIEKMLQNYKYLNGTEALFLFAISGERYTNSPFSVWDLQDFTEKEWFEAAVDQDKSYFWGDPDIRDSSITIPLVRVIRKISFPEKTGYFISNIRESYLFNLYSNFFSGDSSDFYIVNERNVVISHNNKEKIGASLASLVPDFVRDGEPEGHAYSNADNRQLLLIYYTDSRNGWTFINSVPGVEIKRGARYIQLFTYLLSGILIIVCFVLAYFLTRSLIHPINSLVERMEKAQNGDWDVAVETDKKGEIGKLERSFDVMIQELKKAFDEMISIQEQKRSAEFKVLEYQINPHFLYNTMSTIIWLSDIHDNDSVVKVAEALSELFRISISKGSEVITIEDELKHVENYAAIQKVRYPDEFTVEFAVDDAIKSRTTIKLILQPLVENALYHGIKPNERPGFVGMIRLEGAFTDTGDILFRVIDNGSMLEREDIDRLNTFLQTDDRSESDFGVGIQNVHDRVQLAYGLRYGIRFVPADGLTIVEVLIPDAGSIIHAGSILREKDR